MPAMHDYETTENNGQDNEKLECIGKSKSKQISKQKPLLSRHSLTQCVTRLYKSGIKEHLPSKRKNSPPESTSVQMTWLRRKAILNYMSRQPRSSNI